jgi:hypothetical protein
MYYASILVPSGSSISRLLCVTGATARPTRLAPLPAEVATRVVPKLSENRKSHGARVTELVPN